jgi:hypothetical protein
MEINHSCEALILASLEGKYSISEDNEERRKLVAIAFNKYMDSTEHDLLLSSLPSIDLATDIANQVRCYLLIEKFWRYRKPPPEFLQMIHCMVLGLSIGQYAFRNTNIVPGYPNNIPTRIEDVPFRMTEIDDKIVSIDILACENDHNKAAYLAELFAIIIRVHPFADGNGRTARIIVQYCLRYWGYQYIILPKVRNDEVWKEALEMAIKGNYYPLSNYFYSRLSKSNN